VSSYTSTLVALTMRARRSRYRSLILEGTLIMKTPTALAKINTALLDSLAATVDALSRRRARDIPEKTIDQFVAIRWLEWNGGTLRLTEAGETAMLKMQATMLGDMQPG
jgi:hypothetical protein